MLVVELSLPEEKEQLLQEWKNIPSCNVDALFAVAEDLYINSSEWFLVKSATDGTKFAVFDIRQVPPHSPQWHKSLRIHFSPLINVDMSGEDYESAAQQLRKVVAILAHAFERMLVLAETTKDKTCKIHCEHKMVKVIFWKFAEHLDQTYPESYSVKFYGKWVEIKRRSL